MESVAWVTGGIRGLGAQVVRVLAESGFHIAVNYRNSREAAERLAGEVRKMGREVLVLQGDVGRLEDVRRMAGEIRDRPRSGLRSTTPAAAVESASRTQSP